MCRVQHAPNGVAVCAFVIISLQKAAEIGEQNPVSGGECGRGRWRGWPPGKEELPSWC